MNGSVRESEARESACIGPPTCGVVSPYSGQRWCIGRACKLGWRFDELRNVQCGFGHGVDGHPIGDAWGWCGLAGVPAGMNP